MYTVTWIITRSMRYDLVKTILSRNSKATWSGNNAYILKSGCYLVWGCISSNLKHFTCITEFLATFSYVHIVHKYMLTLKISCFNIYIFSTSIKNNDKICWFIRQPDSFPFPVQNIVDWLLVSFDELKR